ncbi:hypothetical protein MKX01_003604, partial [Papaver californicum]
MSQDTEQIKTVAEKWKWSEMQGLELVQLDSAANRFISNEEDRSKDLYIEEQEKEEEEKQKQARERRRRDTVQKENMDISEKRKDGNNGGEKPNSIKPVAFKELFRFADRLDYVLMGIGTVGALVHGCSLPVFLRFFADLVNSFGSNANNVEKMMQEVLKYAFYFLVVGAAIWASSWA